MVDRAVPGSRVSRPRLPGPAYIPGLVSDVPDEDDAHELRHAGEVARLVVLAKAGDADAFGELYRRHHAPIFRYARVRVREGAEDVVAETFLRAWKALGRYRDTGAPFVAWLYGIARHVAADELRRRARVETRADLPDAPMETGVDDRLTLADAMSRLPEQQRQVVELKFLIGLTNAEVAAALGRTEGAVNAKQWRALEGLRAMLEDR